MSDIRCGINTNPNVTRGKIMSWFKNLKISKKFLVVISIITLGFVVFGFYSFSTLNYLKVNGPIYKDIVQGKDLIADILPPPDYIVESYLVVLEMTYEDDKTILDQKAEYLQGKLKKEYYDRHNFWVNDLSAGEMKEIMISDSFTPAEEFYRIVDSEFIPAIKVGNKEKATELANGILKQKYEEHRKHIDKVVSMATEKNAKTEEFAQAEITKRSLALIGVAILSILISFTLFVSVITQIITKINRTKDMLKDISEGEGDLTKRLDSSSNDEIDELSLWFNKFVDKIEKIIATIAQNASLSASIAEELSASSEEVNASAAQVSSTVHEIAKGGQTLSMSAAETQQQSDSLIGSIKSVAEFAQQSAKSACEVNDLARSGGESAKVAGQKMDSIKSSVSCSAEVVTDLGRKSQQINEVIDVINDISEQTNLLALNAAIEAARAGEAGRGFAVVADEVRKLAEESKKATQQIASMIEEISQSTSNTVESMNVGSREVEEGSKVVNEALSSLDTISRMVSELVQQIAMISESTEKQLESSEKVQRAIFDVSAVAEESAAATQQVAASTEETTASMQRVAASAQELTGNADELIKLIGQFKIRDHEGIFQTTGAKTGGPEDKAEENKGVTEKANSLSKNIRSAYQVFKA